MDVAFLVASHSSEGRLYLRQGREARVKNGHREKGPDHHHAHADRSKLDKMLPFTFAELSDINYFITDGPLPDGLVQAAKKAEVKLL